MANKSNTRTRSWLFTLNNPTSLIVLDEDKVSALKILYLVYQKEVGAQGTPHLQGYVYFQNPVRMVGCKAALVALSDDTAKGAHLEVARGTAQQNRDYCTKVDTRVEGPFEYGVIPKQGSRSDLGAIKDLIDSGASEADVAEQYFGQYVRYHNGFRQYRSVTARKRDWKTKVVVHYGSTGLGKTFRAHKLGGEKLYIKDCENKWWERYQGEEQVLLDEFDGATLSINRFKQLGDRGAANVEVKGGSVSWCAKTLYITSNTAPGDWWPAAKSVDFEAVIRRVDEWWHFTPIAAWRFASGEEDEGGRARYDAFLDSIGGRGSRARVREFPDGLISNWMFVNWEEDMLE